MLRLSFIMLATLWYCDCLLVSSSFWAPLYNPRILNYRVDVLFNPDAGKNAREVYVKNNGVRGERLIANLGNGKGPNDAEKENEDIKFYYTYPGASDKNKYDYNFK